MFRKIIRKILEQVETAIGLVNGYYIVKNDVDAEEFEKTLRLLYQIKKSIMDYLINI